MLILLQFILLPILAGRHAAPFLEKCREMMVVRKVQMVGDFLDGHGGVAQQVHGNLQPQGQVVAVRGGRVSTFEHFVGPGPGEMGMGCDLIDMQGAVHILLDIAFHGKSRGGLLLMAYEGLRKQLNVMMKKKSQFTFAVSRVFFHDGESLGEIVPVLEIFHITIGVQMIVRQQVLHQHPPDVEPDLCPGVMRIGIVVVVSAGMEDIGGAGA